MVLSPLYALDCLSTVESVLTPLTADEEAEAVAALSPLSGVIVLMTSCATAFAEAGFMPVMTRPLVRVYSDMGLEASLQSPPLRRTMDSIVE